MPKPEDLLANARRTVDDLASRIGLALTANARVHRGSFERTGARLSLAGVQRMIATCGERLSALVSRKQVALSRRMERLGAKLGAAEKLLEVVSYRSVLARGFALVSADGEPVRSAAAVPRGKALSIEFHDGHVAAVSNGITAAPRRKRRDGGDGGAQGSLL